MTAVVIRVERTLAAEVHDNAQLALVAEAFHAADDVGVVQHLQHLQAQASLAHARNAPRMLADMRLMQSYESACQPVQPLCESAKEGNM